MPRLTTLCLVLAVVATACSGNGAEEREAADGGARGGTAMQLSSSAFAHGDPIPEVYTCDGRDVSPPLAVSGIPAEAAALVLVMDDPDAPGGTWDHWVEFDIPVTDAIPEDVGALGTAGENSWGRTGYGGPCPPGGTHRYFFTVYAVDGALDLAAGATKAEVMDAISGRVLAQAQLMGVYARG